MKYLLLIAVLAFPLMSKADIDCVDCAVSTGRAPAVIIQSGATNAVEMAIMTEKIEEEVETEEAKRALSSYDDSDPELEQLEAGQVSN